MAILELSDEEIKRIKEALIYHYYGVDADEHDTNINIIKNIDKCLTNIIKSK